MRTRIPRTGAALAVAAGLALATALAAPAGAQPAAGHDSATTAYTRHASAHVMPMRGGYRARPLATTLTWNGGPVEHPAAVYLDFWGSQWSDDPAGAANYLQGFFDATGSDSMSNVLTQYYDSSANVSLGQPVLAGVWFDNGGSAPSSASAGQISSEANNAAAHFGVSGPDTDIFVVSPTGTHPDNFPNAGFCAWHDWNGNVAYTNMPYVWDAGSSCGANSVSGADDGFSIVGGHEYSEAATDPEPSSGWVDNSSGEENADLCAWTDLYTDSNGYPVQGTWSNQDGGCQ
jgi:hypothetical protein